MRSRPWPGRLPSARAARRPVVSALLALLAATACVGGGEQGPRPGAAGVGDPLFPRLGNGGYHVRHYGLTLDYDPGTRRLAATAVISARATQDLGSFNLDLKGLTVRAARVDGKPARTRRAGSELTVRPSAPLRKDTAFETVVEYDGEPAEIRDADGSVEGWVRSESDHGVAALGEPSGSMAWFPGNNHLSDKAAYDITVTVPDGYTAVANGELTRTEHRPGGRTAFVWHSAEPLASYLATVAVGRFTVTTGRTPRGLPYYIAAAPEETAAVPGMVKLLPEVVEWESGLFGPFPFSSTGGVVDHNARVGYALETQPKPYYQAAPGDTTIVHELAHQWFGNAVTPSTWRDIWLNEGFATYAEWLWEEKRGGRTTRQIFTDYYDGEDPNSRGPGGRTIWDFPPAAPTPRTLTDPPVYGRGAMVLQKLREAVGDREFFGILRAWVREHRYGNADTKQFIRLCESRTGRDLGALFDTWLRKKGRPAPAG
ncbi:M1 family metallopeptidase [Streptomyces sp. UNOB3_S3]|uniref:M1 family metallopeptidase n=1 Tax=Streptomyces sp. UNOB3_S3 TaxID=2871682 RepID=UPI001E62FACD|nr:M1 family metallopeptidase [Streptomyces sp. UNOB3_S3]MCC3778258.1 M1 family metallopeptidase [Streptomyces sp. UNOB3_S3]